MGTAPPSNRESSAETRASRPGCPGVSILPKLILRRIPYRIAARGLEPPAYRSIGLALRDRKTAPPAVRHFLEYLRYR